jgi:23S rRNA pseudouridine2604 synthase
VSTLGTRVAPDARIEIDADARRHQHEQVTILLNKPVGTFPARPKTATGPASVLIAPRTAGPKTARRSRSSRAICEVSRPPDGSTSIPPDSSCSRRTGRVARRLIGHDSEVEKEYLVRVEGTLSPKACSGCSTASSSTASS